VWWYRSAIAILVLGEGYLLLSGRLAASYRFIGHDGAGSESEFFYHFLTNVLWVAFLAPLAITVVRLANRDKSATAGAAFWRALKAVCVIAWKGREDPWLRADGEARVEEDPTGALLKGVGIALLMPSFFWFGPAPGFLPHTLRTAAWLGVTGLGIGASVYCAERARPFLKPSWHEAQRGRLFRRWWSPYPTSYDPPGNRWIGWYWLFAILTGVTWLGGGAIAMQAAR